jgi:hypothetical protein
MDERYLEMLRKRKKRKERNFAFYVANLIYQWLCVGGLVFYIVAPFVLNFKVGPITYCANFILIPLFSVILFKKTKSALKSGKAPESDYGEHFKQLFRMLGDLLPSMICTSMWLTVAVFHKNDVTVNLIWILSVLMLHFVILVQIYSHEPTNNYYDMQCYLTTHPNAYEEYLEYVLKGNNKNE